MRDLLNQSRSVVWSQHLQNWEKSQMFPFSMGGVVTWILIQNIQLILTAMLLRLLFAITGFYNQALSHF